MKIDRAGFFLLLLDSFLWDFFFYFFLSLSEASCRRTGWEKGRCLLSFAFFAIFFFSFFSFFVSLYFFSSWYDVGLPGMMM